MLTVAGATFAASLLGSIHCAGMCGGLAVVAGAGQSCTGCTGCAGNVRRSVRQAAALQLGYHGARGLSYALLGGIVGVLGSGVVTAERTPQLQSSLAVLVGGTIVLTGLLMILRHFGAPLRLPELPLFRSAPGHRLRAWALRQTAMKRAMTIGLLTPLLPCGWLWAFAAVALAQGNALGGVVVMLSFWLGSVPALVGVVAGAQALVPRLGSAAQLVMGVVLVAVGLETAFHRAPLAERVMTTVAASGAHDSATVGDETPACCREGAP